MNDRRTGDKNQILKLKKSDLPALNRAGHILTDMVAATVIQPALIHIHTGVGGTLQHIPSTALALIQPGQVGALSTCTRAGSTFVNIHTQPISQDKPWVAAAGEASR